MTKFHIKLRQLQEKADKAHDGPWEVVKNEFTGNLSIMAVSKDSNSIHSYQLADILFAGSAEDADYIASFSPDVAKELIQKIYELIKENEDLKFQLSLFEDDLK